MALHDETLAIGRKNQGGADRIVPPHTEAARDIAEPGNQSVVCIIKQKCQ
jgi:hypothetical protein